jgi:tRNA (adenine22-N1)-methyltransferase
MGCLSMKDTNLFSAKLSKRLSLLAEWVPQGARLADIGTDHALVPAFLASNGRISFAVAGDIHAGPVEAAKRQVQEAGLENLVSVRKGDGLAVLSPGEVDTVTIAGMGGSLMVRILEQGIAKLGEVRTLVLSPHVAEDAVRRWLKRHAYGIEREELLEEDGVIYTMIRAIREPDAEISRQLHAEHYRSDLLAPALPVFPENLMYEMGPLLVRRPTAIFYRKWEQEIEKRERVIVQLEHSSASEAAEKAAEWKQDVKEIREVLRCLQEANGSFN